MMKATLGLLVSARRDCCAAGDCAGATVFFAAAAAPLLALRSLAAMEIEGVASGALLELAQHALALEAKMLRCQQHGVHATMEEKPQAERPSSRASNEINAATRCTCGTIVR